MDGLPHPYQVQRVRKVGTGLLEIIQNATDEDLKTRAQAQLRQLLETLARLDSRASDEPRYRDLG